MLGGRKDKLRPGDVLGALTATANGGGGLAGSDVGRIEVGETKTWVAVRRQAAAGAARGLSASKIKKKKFKVHLID